MRSEARAPSYDYTHIVLINILSEACATSEAHGPSGLCPGRGFALSAGGFALVLVAIMALVAARQKRERQVEVIDNLLDSGCPVSKLLRTHLHKAGDAEDDAGVSTNHMRNMIGKQLHSLDDLQTPYGTLIEDMEVPCEGQPPLKLA